MYYKDEGIILNSHSSTEADNIVEILLKHKGRISIVFKGVKKSKSRKLNSADIGNYVEVFIYQKNKQQLPYLREIKVKNHFYNIKKNYTKFLYLNYILELFLNFAHPGEVHIKLFNFLLKVLMKLKDLKEEYLNLFIVYIKFRLVQVAGVLPDFINCQCCHTRKDDLLYLYDSNETVCQDCKGQEESSSAVVTRTLREHLNRVNKFSIEKVNELKIEVEHISLLDKIFKNIIFFYLNKELKSEKILKKMLKNQGV